VLIDVFIDISASKKRRNKKQQAYGKEYDLLFHSGVAGYVDYVMSIIEIFYNILIINQMLDRIFVIVAQHCARAMPS